LVLKRIGFIGFLENALDGERNFCYYLYIGVVEYINTEGGFL